MIKAILKLWPALTPIILYVLWIFVFKKLINKLFRKKDYIDGEFVEIKDKNDKNQQKVNNFSLENPKFVIILYISLVFMIVSLIFLAIK